MNYRKFGKLDYHASILGFGCMRLPLLDDNPAHIDEEEGIRMIRYAIDRGVNYIDTAYFYHNFQSEAFVGKALADGYRDKVMLATKLPVSMCQSYEDFDRLLNEQLRKLATDHIDFYLLHGLNVDSWKKSCDLGVLGFLDQALADGRIRSAGFSFHDEYPLFKEIVDAYPWTFCQIQYNYMDTHFQAGEAGLNYAAQKGLAVVIMEPIKGGRLAKTPPPVIQAVWDNATVKRTPAEWALLWVMNHPEVSVVLSGMSTFEQTEENLNTADWAQANMLTPEELSLFAEVRKHYRDLTKIDCTACGYCQPCPAGVNIPRNFNLYNDAAIYEDIPTSQKTYNLFFKPEARANQCTECGQCVEACPQNLPIPTLLREVHKTLSL